MFSGNYGSMPAYAQNVNSNDMMGASGLGGILSGLFVDQGAPYQQASDTYGNYLNKATGALNPYQLNGQQGMQQFQGWLQQQANPSQFINNLMSHYQQSPMAQYQQQQAIRAANNSGSATGLAGSSAMNQQVQQNASNISSQDMQTWLQNVLGINQQYGQGQSQLMGQGFNAGNALAQLYGRGGENMGQLALGQQAGENGNMSNLFSGIGQLGMAALMA
jgi:hypothetical protein